MSLIRSTLLLALMATLTLSCGTARKDIPDDPQFTDLVMNRYLKDLWVVNPAFALGVGDHSVDPILQVPNKESRQKTVDFIVKYKALFSEIDDNKLSVGQLADKRLIENSLDRGYWYIREFKSYQWEPNQYNVGHGFMAVLSGTTRSLDEKIKSISQRLDKVPDYYKAAQANIKKPSKEHTRLAIKQSKGLIKFFKGELKSKVKKSTLGQSEKKKINKKIGKSVKAVQSYVRFLNGVLKRPAKVGGFRSFRLGKKLYDQKFKYDLQITLNAEQAYQKALETKYSTLEKMAEVARSLFAKYYGTKMPPKGDLKVIQMVIDKVAKQHTKPEEFVNTIRQQIPQLAEFVRKRDLLTLDPSRPLKVRETPIYMRGRYGASVDAPGPFEPKRETYYNVTPLDGMTKKRQSSYLREYNDYTLQILNIHEAIPGHYAQLVYSNKSSSLIKKMYHNTPLIEGWAVYSERMMLEEGYGAESPELWLMYYKWFLRVVTNTILDYEVHVKNISKKAAMKLMVVDAFQEEAEAEQKWERVTTTQVQLASYFTGFSEIYDFREQIKKDRGKRFKLKQFHEKFLSYGNAPIGTIKELMLE